MWLTEAACGRGRRPADHAHAPDVAAAAPDSAPAPAPDVAAAAPDSAPDVAAAAPDSAPRPSCAPDAAPAPIAAGAPVSGYVISGGTTGTLVERAAGAMWPGEGGPLAHFLRKTATGEVDAVGLDDASSQAKRLVWAVTGKAGMAYFAPSGDGGLEGHWVLTGGDDRVGDQTATLVGTRAPDADPFAGSYTLAGRNRDAATTYKGKLVVTRAGDRYELVWTIGSTEYKGVALAEEHALFGCWNDDPKVAGAACGVALYQKDAAGGWKGRSTLSDAPAVVAETLVADPASAPLSLEVITPEEPDPECVAACKSKGLCGFSAMDDGCYARSDDDCARADNCPGHRGCVVAGRVCVSAEVAAKHCKQTLFGFLRSCAEEGWCSVVDGNCSAANDGDCAASEACTQDGRCTAREGRCVATSDASCAAAKACKDDHRCVAKDGACWVAASAIDGCKDACQQRGECALDAGVCRPPDAASCQASAACKRDGRCESPEAGAPCTVSDDGCIASEVCKRDKACTDVLGKCRAVTQAYCTDLCSTGDGSAQLGLCTAVGGRCINPEDEH